MTLTLLSISRTLVALEDTIVSHDSKTIMFSGKVERVYSAYHFTKIYEKIREWGQPGFKVPQSPPEDV